MENIVQPESGKKLKFDKHKVKQLLIELLPLLALVALFVVYLILLSAKDYNIEKSLKLLLNQSVILAMVATGAIFIFTLGSFDVSLGASTMFSAAVGLLAFKASGNVFVMFLVCVLVAVACSLCNSLIASFFRIPMFVTTVAMMSVLTAVGTTIINTKGEAVGDSMAITVPLASRAPLSALDEMWFKILLLALFAVICLFVFSFTKIGRRQKFIGSNMMCAKMTGISINLYSIIAFVMAGIGVGLGAFLSNVYTPTVSSSTASDIGMSVFIAIVFGGMPISGGPRSKIYAALVGGFSFMVLKNILFILLMDLKGARDGYVQLISAIMFLAIVFVASINYRTKNLPR